MDYYYRRSKNVASRVVSDEAMLVKLRENLLIVLNPSASRIWVDADGTRRGTELGEGLDTASVQVFLDKMVSMGLLERNRAQSESPDVFPQAVELTVVQAEPPEIRASEPIEVLAGTCGSQWDGLGGCRITICTTTND